MKHKSLFCSKIIKPASTLAVKMRHINLDLASCRCRELLCSQMSWATRPSTTTAGSQRKKKKPSPPSRRPSGASARPSGSQIYRYKCKNKSTVKVTKTLMHAVLMILRVIPTGHCGALNLTEGEISTFREAKARKRGGPVAAEGGEGTP